MNGDNGNKGSGNKGITSTFITPERVWDWYRDAFEKSSDFRNQAAIDCDYYDNEQWTEQEKMEMKRRGQPSTVINRIKPTIDLVLGTEAKVRTDFKAAPRKSNGTFDAGIATECIKFVMDANQGEFLVSEAFEGQVKAGWDFIELSKSDDPFKEIIQMTKVARNDLFWDRFATEYDLSDAKFFVRHKWGELEDFIPKFPKFKDLLESAVSDEEVEPFKEQPYHGTEDQPDRPGVKFWTKTQISSTDWIEKSRKRVKLLECWYKVPTKVFLVDNYLTGDIEELNPSKIYEVLSTPGATITKATIKKVRMCIVAGSYLLYDDWSPYRHNEYPFIPWWCFIKDKDRSPYGLIRQKRDPQDEVNKRRSKAMHLLNSTQIIATSDSIDKKENDWRRVADQISDPQGIIILSENKPNAKFEIRNPMAIIEEQYKFEEEAKREIEEADVNRELMGLESNASSGRAIIARQIQGNTILGKPFNNYRRSRQLLGQRIWAMIQQYWTRPKVLRITNKVAQSIFGENAGLLPGNKENKFVSLNAPVNFNGKIYIKNDITRAKVDITIDEQAFNATVRQTLADEMSLLIGKLPPEIGLIMLDEVIELQDVPNKDRLIQKIQMAQAAFIQQAQVRQENERVVAEATRQKAESNAVNRSAEEKAMKGGLPS